MSHAFYLTSKAVNKPASIFIKINPHNANGWIEKQNGKVIKLFSPNQKHK
jgi:hypothetical protein